MSVLDYVESKALKIIGISHDVAEAQGLLLSHCKQVGGLVFFCTSSPISLLLLTHLSDPPYLVQDADLLSVSPSL